MTTMIVLKKSFNIKDTCVYFWKIYLHVLKFTSLSLTKLFLTKGYWFPAILSVFLQTIITQTVFAETVAKDETLPVRAEAVKNIQPIVDEAIDTATKTLPQKINKDQSIFFRGHNYSKETDDLKEFDYAKESDYSEESDHATGSNSATESDTADEPDYSNEPDDDSELEKSPTTAIRPLNSQPKIIPAGSDTTINNSSPIIMGQGEDFVNAFENFVATKIVPKVPGLALAIIADGKVKVLQGYGAKRTGGNDLVNTNTVFRLASVSKTIASTAAGVMVRDGKISWDTTITSQLPEVIFSNPRYGDKITLRDIMSQATGLPTHTNTHLIEDNVPYADAVGRLRYVNFICPPSKCYAYQNVTFSLIGNLILKKTGTAYEKYVSEKLFKPLGMTSASFGLAGLQATNNFAQPHVMNRSRWMTTNIEENYYHIYPAAGANASITDMSQWVLAQMGHNPEILPSELLNQLHQKITRNTPAQSHYGANVGATDTHYGLGWRIFDYRGDKNFVHHGGWVKGFRSEVVFNQELQIGMVFLTNSETKLARNIIFKFLDTYEDEKHGVKNVAQEKSFRKFKVY